MDNDRIWNLVAKKLAGEASASDLNELESALRHNPELHYSLEAMDEMWKNHPDTMPEQSEAAFKKHMDRMYSLGMDIGTIEPYAITEDFPTVRLPFSRWKKPAILACGLLLFTLGFHFLNLRNTNPPVLQQNLEVVTRNGTKTNIQLPDGTSVWLNAGSRLSYDSLYGNNLREVNLSGEAYFEVVKNPDKPFIIHTGKINIKVLGTIFNVKSYPGEKTIETSLIKGSIEVSFPSSTAKKIILKPNQKLVIDKSESFPAANMNSTVMSPPKPFISIQHLSKVGSDSVIEETGWVQNRLYFKDISFHELMQRMERKYGLSFQLIDISLDTIHFTGSFQNETVTQALDALRLTAEQSTTDFTYEMQGNKVFIYKNATGIHSNQPK